MMEIKEVTEFKRLSDKGVIDIADIYHIVAILGVYRIPLNDIVRLMPSALDCLVGEKGPAPDSYEIRCFANKVGKACLGLIGYEIVGHKIDAFGNNQSECIEKIIRLFDANYGGLNEYMRSMSIGCAAKDLKRACKDYFSPFWVKFKRLWSKNEKTD